MIQDHEIRTMLHTWDDYFTYMNEIEENVIADCNESGIRVLRYNVRGDKGILLEFQNGNRVEISTENKYHPLVISHETSEHREERLREMYKDDTDMNITQILATDTTIE